MFVCCIGAVFLGRHNVFEYGVRSERLDRSSMSAGSCRAVFLDRDGVLIEDNGLLIRAEEIRLFDDAPSALALFKSTGFLLIVVTNQTVVSRGLASEEEVAELNRAVRDSIVKAGGPLLDAFYVCPHHPNATLERYRKLCDCRKPRPGMLFQAAREWDIDLGSSFMIGDRITDIAAGASAGCRTILLRTGAHLVPPIETVEPLDPELAPNFACDTLTEAAEWILETPCGR